MAVEVVREALCSGRLTINPLDDGSGVVLDVDGEQLLTMNPTGLQIMTAIDAGAESIDEITSAITGQFEVGPDQARSDGEEFIRKVASVLQS